MHKLLLIKFHLLFCFSLLAQPPGKHWEAVAYHEETNELAVFSGAEYSGNKFMVTDSLWLFKNQWRLIDNNSVTGRWAHAMVYHGNTLYTYGGLVLNEQQQETVLNDLYKYENSWTRIAEGPKLSLPFLFSVEGKLLLAGQPVENKKTFVIWELKDKTLQELHSFNLQVETEILKTLRVKTSFVIVYQSDSGLVLNNLNTGQTMIVKNLPARTKFDISYNSKMDLYYLFGGLNEKSNFSNDLWQIKNGSAEKLIVKNPPSPRASCHLLPTANGFILYGGVQNGGKLVAELWLFESGNWNHVKF